MDKKIQAILSDLDEEQQRAVKCKDGAVLIVAGAGSGKTRVLTSRIAYMLESGIEPQNILALTFTKKAASEMRERIAALVGAHRSRYITMGTFHSVFVRFLRKYSDSIDYPEKFTIYDTSDSISAVKTCIKELGLDDKVYKPREVLSRISKAKNNLITVKEYRSRHDLLDDDIYSKKPRMRDLYELYQKRLKESGVMDFDDILVNMNILLKDNTQALDSLSAQYKYIMVDEYQDTNYAQYLILKKLSGKNGNNICVVGDDSQSIYAFRGAKIENILNFKKDNPECKIFRLERNYRSTCNIVDAANSLIAHNSNRIPKTCYAEGERGEKIDIIKSYSAEEEAANIVYKIQDQLRLKHASYRDFAILYRTNAQSRALEEQLRRRNIPYTIVSGNSFFERAEVKDMMAYFKLCVNPDDNESFRRVVNKPTRGIGDVTVNSLSDYAIAKGESLFRAGFSAAKVRPFCEMIQRLSSLTGVTEAGDMADRIAEESGLYAYYKADTSIEGLSRTANVEELLNSVKSFVEERQNNTENIPEEEVKELYTLDDFLENVSLLSSVDIENEEDDGNKVALMTVHSAKGLEFPYVFISGLEENLFPSQSMTVSFNDLEEERRLFYVALTRAEEKVYLSYALSRMRNGKHETNVPSRFIKEIDSSCIENPLDDSDYSNEGVRHEWGGFGERFTGGRFDRLRQTPYSAKKQPVIIEHKKTSVAPIMIDPNFKATPMSEFYEGQRIEHNRFGAGKILSLSGNAPDIRAEIHFDRYGEKTLLLKYAQMRPEKAQK